jgi:hypothetical protein
MSFIFAETQGMQSAAASTANLAADTTNAGGQARSGVVLAPGLDLTSAHNAAMINGYTSEVAARLLTGAGLQVNYGESVSNAANAYTLVDSLNATELST